MMPLLIQKIIHEKMYINPLIFDTNLQGIQKQPIKVVSITPELLQKLNTVPVDGKITVVNPKNIFTVHTQYGDLSIQINEKLFVNQNISIALIKGDNQENDLMKMQLIIDRFVTQSTDAITTQLPDNNNGKIVKNFFFNKKEYVAIDNMIQHKSMIKESIDVEKRADIEQAVEVNKNSLPAKVLVKFNDLNLDNKSISQNIKEVLINGKIFKGDIMVTEKNLGIQFDNEVNKLSIPGKIVQQNDKSIIFKMGIGNANLEDLNNEIHPQMNKLVVDLNSKKDSINKIPNTWIENINKLLTGGEKISDKSINKLLMSLPNIDAANNNTKHRHDVQSMPITLYKSHYTSTDKMQQFLYNAASIILQQSGCDDADEIAKWSNFFNISDGVDELIEIKKQFINLLHEYKAENSKAGNNWNTFIIPIFDGKNLEYAKLFVKRNQQTSDGLYVKRFVIEINTKNKYWADCFFSRDQTKKALDIIFRMEEEMPAEMQENIRNIFNNTIKSISINGEITFCIQRDDYGKVIIKENQKHIDHEE